MKHRIRTLCSTVGGLLASLHRTTLAVVAVTLPLCVLGAELIIDDGVVIKFNPGTSLVVRDKATLGNGVVFTSRADGSVGGQITQTSATPTVASWRGIRVEKSASSSGIKIDGTTIRYAGQNDTPALSLRGVSPGIQYLQLTDNLLGLRLTDAASPAITGSRDRKSVV